MWCFFFKQKTAYEVRISYWSSDVCSSDLPPGAVLDQSIFRDWQGLFPLKDQDNGQQRQNRNQSGSSSLDAMRRAIELTGGPEERGPVESGGVDWRADPVPDPVRALGYVQR